MAIKQRDGQSESCFAVQIVFIHLAAETVVVATVEPRSDSGGQIQSGQGARPSHALLRFGSALRFRLGQQIRSVFHGLPDQVSDVGGRGVVKRGLNHVHVGSLHAADDTMALTHARDLYTRRNEGVSIWVVRADDITASSPAEKDPFFAPAGDKVYRHPTFYAIPEEVPHL
jgi:ring-1,2-phenylacetyl-CoA epoxidase subunit PaaB